MGIDVILLVDDSPDDVLLTVRAFRRNNITHEIIVARDGVEALELLLPTNGRMALYPVIVLMDISMPRMNGLEALQVLRADPSTKSLPVIMLSSSIVEQDISRSYDGGANSYLQKPVDAEEFTELARTLGVYWLDMNKRDPAHVG
jgi:two-component system response regulator